MLSAAELAEMRAVNRSQRNLTDDARLRERGIELRHPAKPPHEQWMHAGKAKAAAKKAAAAITAATGASGKPSKPKRGSSSDQALVAKFAAAATGWSAVRAAPDFAETTDNATMKSHRDGGIRTRDKFRIDAAVADHRPDGSIGGYAGRDYEPINRALYAARGGKLPKATPDETRQQIADLRWLFDNSQADRDIIVYRGVRNPRDAFTTKAAKDAWGGNVVGLEWTQKGISSTSAGENHAVEFAEGRSTGYRKRPDDEPTVFRILVPKGTAAVRVTDLEYPGVGEIALRDGVRYRVVADHGVVDGMRRVDLAVMG